MQLTGYGNTDYEYPQFYYDDNDVTTANYVLEALADPESSNPISAPHIQENRSLARRCSASRTDSLSSLTHFEESHSRSSTENSRINLHDLQELEEIDTENKASLEAVNESRLQVFQWLRKQGGTSNEQAVEKVRLKLGLTRDTVRDYYSKFTNDKLRILKKHVYNVHKGESVPQPNRSVTNDDFSDSEDFLLDPDRISSQGSLENISNEFRAKIFEILQRAGGLKNEKARNAAIKATGYEPASFDATFRKSLSGKLPEMKRKLYRFQENEPQTLAQEFNKRIRYLKKESAPSSIKHFTENFPTFVSNEENFDAFLDTL